MSANKPKDEKPGIPFTFKRKKFRGVQLPAREEEFKPEVEAFLNFLNREWRCRYRSFKLTGILLMPFPDMPSYAWHIPPSHWVYICEDDKQIGHCEPERFESEYLRSDGLDVEQLQSQIESGVVGELRCSSSRDQFEAWYRSLWPNPISENEFAWTLRWKSDKQRYSDSTINLAWRAWQASAKKVR